MTIGIDPSFTSTGIVQLDQKYNIVRFDTFTSDPTHTKLLRAQFIANCCLLFCHGDDIVIEDLAYNAKGRSSRDMAGLLYLILDRLDVFDVTLVAPTTLKKITTGKGNATKQQMFEHLPVDVQTQFQSHKSKYDLCDAYHLASYGLIGGVDRTAPDVPNHSVAFDI